jgi:putative DNA primase/helicase
VTHMPAYRIERDAPAAETRDTPTTEIQTYLEVLCLANVKAKAVDWLWPSRIAIGKVSCFAGEGGLGKSTILLDLAGRVSNGEPWPDGAEATAAGSVIILSAEDDPADTIKPRLMAVHAKLEHIHIIRAVIDTDKRRAFNLQADLARLEAEIARLSDVRLVIIDPVSSYLGKIDSHKNAEVRSVLEPLAEMAARLKVAIICNTHFSKAGGNANNRIIGSVAFANQARANFIVTPDAEDQQRRLLVPSKTSLVPPGTGLAYRIEGVVIDADDGQQIFTSRIAWETTPITISADEAVTAYNDNGEARTATAEAIEFLTKTLAHGSVGAAEVQRDAHSAGITPKALRRAREALRIKPEKAGFERGWVWALPKMPNTSEDAHACKWAPSRPEGTFDSRSTTPADHQSSGNATPSAQSDRTVPAALSEDGRCAAAGSAPPGVCEHCLRPGSVAKPVLQVSVTGRPANLHGDSVAQFHPPVSPDDLDIPPFLRRTAS